MCGYSVFIVWSEEDEVYLAETPELPGCVADGKTHAEALANLEQIRAEWLETARELKRPVPPPVSTEVLRSQTAEGTRQLKAQWKAAIEQAAEQISQNVRTQSVSGGAFRMRISGRWQVASPAEAAQGMVRAKGGRSRLPA